MNFSIKCVSKPKSCAHIARTKSTECPDARNQGSIINNQSRDVSYVNLIYVMSYFQRGIAKNLNFVQKIIRNAFLMG